MDKSWMIEPRSSNRYLDGLAKFQFLDFAFQNVAQGDQILCPCKNCNNCSWSKREEVYDHLICDGFDGNYKKWIFPGEGGSSKSIHDNERENFNMHDNLHSMLEETFMMPTDLGENESDDDDEDLDTETAGFSKLVHDAHREVYPGCKKFSKLSIIVWLLHIKNMHGWSKVSFNMLLQLLKELLPENSCLPSTFQDCKFIIKDLGFGYEKIHARPNDCILFQKEYENAIICPVCKSSRYKKVGIQNTRRKVSFQVASPLIPAKVLRYFPLTPRIKRLYMSSKTAELMKWHDEGRTKDGKLRHPADSLAWKTFDSRHPNFAADPRNVRLGLASDGFSPCKMMLSLLIPGSIDVYLDPLIDELKELWEKGFETYDASSKHLFQARAALLWTINDFPAYGLLSGWSTGGRMACPVCNYNTGSRHLKHSQKICYMGHRRFLDSKHRWRKDKKSFDGTKELKKT